MEKLNINLIKSEEEILSKYNKEKSEFIANYPEEYIPGGFLSFGYYKKQPLQAEVEWNKKYPNGVESWKEEWSGFSIHDSLTSKGQQTLINKINEIIDFINEIKVVK